MLHTALCCLLAPKKPARHARGVGCMQQRSSTLLCARYWSSTLASTCLLPAAADLLLFLLLLLLHALADAQHLMLHDHVRQRDPQHNYFKNWN